MVGLTILQYFLYVLVGLNAYVTFTNIVEGDVFGAALGIIGVIAGIYGVYNIMVSMKRMNRRRNGRY